METDDDESAMNSCIDYLKFGLRASVNRGGGRMKNGHGMFPHSGSPLSFPNRRSMPSARTPTLPHRAHLRAVSCPPSRAKDGPSARVPPLARPREDSLREAGAGTRLRLRLSQDRR